MPNHCSLHPVHSKVCTEAAVLDMDRIASVFDEVQTHITELYSTFVVDSGIDVLLNVVVEKWFHDGEEKVFSLLCYNGGG